MAISRLRAENSRRLDKLQTFPQLCPQRLERVSKHLLCWALCSILLDYHIMATPEKAQGESIPIQEAEHDAGDIGDVVSLSHLHRTLDNRQIQLIAIGGSIGTGLFVSIGYGLIEGGPGSLFIAFTMYSIWLAAVNNSMAEMATFMPVAGGWVCKPLRRSSHVEIRVSD